MLKRLLILLQTIAIIIPVGIFFTYIIANEGDQFTFEHYLTTGMALIPLLIVLMIKYVVYGFRKT